MMREKMEKGDGNGVGICELMRPMSRSNQAGMMNGNVIRASLLCPISKPGLTVMVLTGYRLRFGEIGSKRRCSSKSNEMSFSHSLLHHYNLQPCSCKMHLVLC